jgi:hypothetical protein
LVRNWYKWFESTTRLKNNSDYYFSKWEMSKNYDIEIDLNLYYDLNKTSTILWCSIFSILYYAYAKVISKILKKKKLIIWTLFNWRTKLEFQNILWTFVYPIPLPIDIDKNELDIFEKINYFNENYVSTNFFRELELFNWFPEETYFTDTFIMLNNYWGISKENDLWIKVHESLSKLEWKYLNIFNINELKEMCWLFLICTLTEKSLNLNFWYHYNRFSENEIEKWSKMFINELTEITNSPYGK